MKKLALLTAVFLLIFTSCKKDEEEESITTTTELQKPTDVEITPSASGISIGGSNYEGSMFAFKSRTINTHSGFDSTLLAATAYFYANVGNTQTPIDAGDVSIDGLKMMNFSGFYYGPDTNQTYSYTNSVTWNVTGGNGYTPFTRSIIGFPAVPDFYHSDYIYEYSSYNVALNNASATNCDLIIVYFIQYGEVKAYKYYLTSQNIPSTVTFTSPQLQGMTSTDPWYGNYAYLQIAYYNLFQSQEGGKLILYGNCTTTSVPVYVQ